MDGSVLRGWLGCYTGPAGDVGIEVVGVDGLTGEIWSEGRVDRIRDPSYLALAPHGGNLYAVSEQPGFGEVVAYGLREDRRLERLSARASGGRGPCHLSVHPTGRRLLTAHYGDGVVAVHPVTAGGELGEATCVVRHRGSGPARGRQDTAHPHMALSDPSGAWVLVVDLGADMVVTYSLDHGADALVEHDRVKLPPAAAPGTWRSAGMAATPTSSANRTRR